MNYARLNLSHGTFSEHTAICQTVRILSASLNIAVGILVDVPGPKYRTGAVLNNKVILKKGAAFTLTSRSVIGNAEIVSVNYPGLSRDVKSGSRVLVNDGAIELKVVAATETDVLCKVIAGGELTARRGVVVPGMKSSVPFITPQLRDYLEYAASINPDFIALSFVGNAEDVENTRAILSGMHQDIPIISKIERADAIRNFDRILKASDGIMVARGDMGVEIPLPRVPIVQKAIIRKCNQAAKPVITATQMLESMINNPSPTRAEVTDVANAIFDGTDAIMLSAETSIGKHPDAAVKMMARISETTELALEDKPLVEMGNSASIDEVISYNAYATARQLHASAIVAFTQSGITARRVARYRPQMPVIALTPVHSNLNRLLLSWGIVPYEVENTSHISGLLNTAVQAVKELGFAKPGDSIVITGGIPTGIPGTTNLLKVEKVV